MSRRELFPTMSAEQVIQRVGGAQENPAKIPAKYLGGLKGKAREARDAEIEYRREHRSNEPFETDKGRATKHSAHAEAFAAKYGRAPKDTADAAKLSGVPKKVLDEVYARGLAAWQTGHRPGASQHAWAMARVESFLTGGPTSRTADADLAAKVQNPPSEGFDPLSEGSRAIAYVKGKVVEIAVGPKFFLKEHRSGLEYDLSREVMIRAWQLATPEARKHLPKIERLRAEVEQVPLYDLKWNLLGQQPATKFWYQLPYYGEEEWADANIRRVETLQRVLTSLDRYDATNLKRLPQTLQEAIAAIAAAAQEYKSKAWNYGWDLYEWKNFSLQRGVLVLRDPIGSQTTLENMLELWKEPAKAQNPAEQTFIPPPAVAAEARKGITLRASQPPSNRCCTPVGLRRAVQLANRQPVSETTLRRMKAYFDRHYGPDSRGKGWGVDSRGWQAHLCWGGDAGRKWVESILGGR